MKHLSAMTGGKQCCCTNGTLLRYLRAGRVIHDTGGVYQAIDINMKYGNEKLVFKLVRNSDEEWVIQKADDFTDLFGDTL